MWVGRNFLKQHGCENREAAARLSENDIKEFLSGFR